MGVWVNGNVSAPPAPVWVRGHEKGVWLAVVAVALELVRVKLLVELA